MPKLNDLVDEPVEFFKLLQNRYALINPKISQLAKELADEHIRQAKSSVGKPSPDMGQAKTEDQVKN